MGFTSQHVAGDSVLHFFDWLLCYQHWKLLLWKCITKVKNAHNTSGGIQYNNGNSVIQIQIWTLILAINCAQCIPSV